MNCGHERPLLAVWRESVVGSRSEIWARTALSKLITPQPTDH